MSWQHTIDNVAGWNCDQKELLRELKASTVPGSAASWGPVELE
jgi:hypothetical protein